MANAATRITARKMSRGKAAILAATASLLVFAGCRSSDDGSLPTVFGAVFGADGARSVPYQVGKIAEPVVGPRDKVIGDAANNPGQCIFRTPNDRRYRAPCPKGYAIGDVN